MYSVFIFNILKVWFGYKKWIQLFSVFVFNEYEYSGIFVNIVKTQSYFILFSNVMCVSEKGYFLWNRKQWPNPDMTYSIPKLCIQNNLPNTTKYENKYFFYI